MIGAGTKAIGRSISPGKDISASAGWINATVTPSTAMASGATRFGLIANTPTPHFKLG
jgi:hypothetical protein